MCEVVIWRCPLDGDEIVATRSLVPAAYETVEHLVERHEYLVHGIEPDTLALYYPDQVAS
jgi:hypothetical protein